MIWNLTLPYVPRARTLKPNVVDMDSNVLIDILKISKCWDVLQGCI